MGAGLSNMLKTELSDARAEQLMNEFDKSGDGVLSLNEFVPPDQFRNRLEILAQEERRLASEAQKKAKEEEEFAILLTSYGWIAIWTVFIGRCHCRQRQSTVDWLGVGVWYISYRTIIGIHVLLGVKHPLWKSDV